MAVFTSRTLSSPLAQKGVEWEGEGFTVGKGVCVLRVVGELLGVGERKERGIFASTSVYACLPLYYCCNMSVADVMMAIQIKSIALA